MRIRLAILACVTALTVTGCSSLHHDYAGGGSMDGTTAFDPAPDNLAMSETQLPDYREIIAEPGF